MLCLADLISLEPFDRLPQKRLEWLCDRAQSIKLHAGEVLAREGDAPRGLFILVTGQMSITRHSEGSDIPIGQHRAPSFFGEIPILTDEPALVTIKAIVDCRIYEIAGEDFRTLLHENRDFERMVFRIMQRRARGLESFIRGREKMAALGTLAAGLAHELNNPSAALVRALKEMPAINLQLQKMNLIYGQQQVEAEHTQQWLELRDLGYDTILHNPIDPITLNDREDELLNWLEAYGVKEAWKLAAPLAEAGVTIESLAQLTMRWQDDPSDLREMGLHWLSLSFEMMSMIKHGLQGAEHIAELVQAMKSYSYMDQGVQQEVNLHQGLEDTLRLFAHKLKHGIQVQRNYDPRLRKIWAYGSELNQVWTNLIDNAINAMDGKGVLEITTKQYQQFARIDIIDSGIGIPSDVQSRIFEPFFTTKPVGNGSGLGLETTRRIVENRHYGTISFESKPGRTHFTVCLPLGY